MVFSGWVFGLIGGRFQRRPVSIFAIEKLFKPATIKSGRL